MIISKSKTVKNKRFTYKPRYVKEEDEKYFDFKSDGLMSGNRAAIAGQLKGKSPHIKRDKTGVASRTGRFALLMLLFGNVYMIYTDRVNIYLGFAMLMVFLVVFINKTRNA